MKKQPTSNIIKKPKTNEQTRMIDDCLADRRVHMLDDWEYHFITSLRDERVLSHTQSRKLTEAWERVTEEG